MTGKTHLLTMYFHFAKSDVRNSRAKSHHNPTYRGVLLNECEATPALFKTVKNYTREDFYRPVNLAQFGVIELFFRYFCRLIYIDDSETEQPNSYLTALFIVGCGLLACAADFGVEEAKLWLSS